MKLISSKQYDDYLYEYWEDTQGSYYHVYHRPDGIHTIKVTKGMCEWSVKQ